jgi:hypothetical protein
LIIQSFYFFEFTEESLLSAHKISGSDEAKSFRRKIKHRVEN